MQDRSALRLRPLGIMRPATAEHQYARTSPGGCRRHPCLDVTAIRETDGLDMKQKLVHSRAVRDSIPTLNALCDPQYAHVVPSLRHLRRRIRRGGEQ